MSRRPQESLTLGELIAAVSDEVFALTRTTGSCSFVVSQVVSDLFATGRVRLKKGRKVKFS